MRRTSSVDPWPLHIYTYRNTHTHTHMSMSMYMYIYYTQKRSSGVLWHFLRLESSCSVYKDRKKQPDTCLKKIWSHSLFHHQAGLQQKQEANCFLCKGKRRSRKGGHCYETSQAGKTYLPQFLEGNPRGAMGFVPRTEATRMGSPQSWQLL